tara:strand:- start:2391 stop:3374 length:984 start_codon:yes stop_codon:yes gene_type:complete
LKIYYSGTPTRRGKDVSKYLDLIYIQPRNKKNGNDSNIISKFYNIIKSVFIEVKALKKLNPTHIIFEHAGDFNPTLTVFIFCFFYRVKLVVDCHTCVYVDADYRYIKKLVNKKIIDFSKIFIAHNQETLTLKNLHNNMFSLESKVPFIEKSKDLIEIDKSKTNVVFITRFNSDEPIFEMINCTNFFGNDFQFFMTGNYNKILKTSDLKKYKNLTFTGFVSDEKYNSIIYNCDIHVVLTKRDFTLLYGGRESISLEKPLVISDNRPCKNFFNKGSVFVSNNSRDIANGIMIAKKNKVLLSRQMKILKKEKKDIWDSKIKDLKMKIDLI